MNRLRLTTSKDLGLNPPCKRRLKRELKKESMDKRASQERPMKDEPTDDVFLPEIDVKKETKTHRVGRVKDEYTDVVHFTYMDIKMEIGTPLPR